MGGWLNAGDQGWLTAAKAGATNVMAAGANKRHEFHFAVLQDEISSGCCGTCRLIRRSTVLPLATQETRVCGFIFGPGAERFDVLVRRRVCKHGRLRLARVALDNQRGLEQQCAVTRTSCPDVQSCPASPLFRTWEPA